MLSRMLSFTSQTFVFTIMLVCTSQSNSIIPIPVSDAIPLIKTATFGEGIGNIYLDNVRCLGHEDNITQCSHNGILRHNCRHREDAGVLCKRKYKYINIMHLFGGVIFN